MIVTGIERQKRHPGRYSLFVDGGIAAMLRRDTLVRSGLRAGDPVDPETLARLVAEDAASGALADALRYVRRRRKTEHEIRSRLTALSHPPDVVDTALRSLRASGVADDRAYVRAFIHDAALQRPAGSLLIHRRLRGKGIPPSILREELDAAFASGEEERLALRCARAHLRRIERREAAGRSFPPGEKPARLRRHLAGRGFSGAAAAAAVAELLGGARRGA